MPALGPAPDSPRVRPESALRTPFEQLKRQGSMRRKRRDLIAQGLLVVEVIGAKDLLVVDPKRGTSDPFCMVVLQETPPRSPSPPPTQPSPMPPRPGFRISPDGTPHYARTPSAQDHRESVMGGVVGGVVAMDSDDSDAADKVQQRPRRRRGSVESSTSRAAREVRFAPSDRSVASEAPTHVSVMLDGVDISDPAHLLAMYVVQCAHTAYEFTMTDENLQGSC